MRMHGGSAPTYPRERCVPIEFDQRSQMSNEFVRLEVADGVGTIRLDRPKMNAISFQVQDELIKKYANNKKG